MSNKHLSVESLYLYVDHVFACDYENWSHGIKHKSSLSIITYFFCKILIGYHIYRFNK